MIPSEFDYVKAGSVQEALGLLQQHGDDAKVLCWMMTSRARS